MADCGEREMSSRVPVIVILGATGCGKSKLGIEIARRFGGEILSADSMQVYKGLDIVTNKVTPEEKCLAPHHLLDIVEPLQRFTVLDFRNRAVPIIDRLIQNGKLPVIVGGTNYYIESLLWKVLVEEDESSLGIRKQVKSASNEVCLDDKRQRVQADSELVYERDRRRMQEARSQEDLESKNLSVQGDLVDLLDEAALEHVPSSHLYEKLQAVDPDMAQGLHPNNKRKIIRSLQVYAQTSRTHSAILREQRSADGGSELGGPLRYPYSCILWLQCEQEVLDERLHLRVDAMLEQGLLKELLDFHRLYNEERLATSTEADYTKGIFQAIGFKEFHQYLLLSEEDRNSEKGSKFFHAGVDALKLVTKRYARRQLRWINNRFLRKTSRQVPPVYGLDATDPYFWNERVLGPAFKIVESYLEGQKPDGVEPLPVTEQSVKNELKTKHCDICDRMFVGDIQWNDHLRSKKHRRMLKRKQVL
ncbi:hypothetical protein Cfor_06651 [Coptotermes formosanus]|uniref:C2H2-type domain-containing protein n=1 Tax=Coptotermes formosanus TaxID=36987 RepID=A0A6L2Q882_COPFO|nr:hypothetical protein Cfor_06651 [Coptotermes formosanus]